MNASIQRSVTNVSVMGCFLVIFCMYSVVCSALWTITDGRIRDCHLMKHWDPHCIADWPEWLKWVLKENNCGDDEQIKKKNEEPMTRELQGYLLLDIPPGGFSVVIVLALWITQSVWLFSRVAHPDFSHLISMFIYFCPRCLCMWWLRAMASHQIEQRTMSIIFMNRLWYM